MLKQDNLARMEKVIYEIKGFLKGVYQEERQLIIDHWESLEISLADFKRTVFDIGINYAREHGVKYWIVNDEHATGQYTDEVRSFAEKQIAPACTDIGIQVMFIVVPHSPDSRLSAREISNINASQKGMLNIEVSNAQDAFDLIDEIASLPK